jgi:hypothetical protein
MKPDVDSATALLIYEYLSNEVFKPDQRLTEIMMLQDST